MRSGQVVPIMVRQWYKFQTCRRPGQGRGRGESESKGGCESPSPEAGDKSDEGKGNRPFKTTMPIVRVWKKKNVHTSR